MNTDNTTTQSQGDETVDAKTAVGQLLREARDRAGLSIADVARSTRISQRYLEALEDGRSDDLPGLTYAIGFVRSYSEHLNLDGDEIVRRYKSGADGSGRKAELVFPKPIPDSGVPGAAVLGIGVVLAAIAYGVWYWNSNSADVSLARVEPVPEHMAASTTEQPVASPQEQAVSSGQPVEPPAEGDDAGQAATEQLATEQAAPEHVAAEQVDATIDAGAQAAQDTVDEAAAQASEATSQAQAPVEDQVEAQVEPQVAAVGDVAAQAPDEAPAETAPAEVAATAPTAVAETAPAPQPVTDDGPSRVTVRAKSNSWIQIRDVALDRLLFTRLLREGDEYVVPNRKGLQLMTGNAGALELIVDGKAVPAIGAIGEVRRNVDLDPDKLKSGAGVSQ